MWCWREPGKIEQIWYCKCFQTVEKVLKTFQDKLLKHDCNCTNFYTWTLQWRFLDRKDSCNSVRCHRESVYVSMCVTEVWEVCPRWLWDWSSSSTTPLVFSKFLQEIWRHWSCALDPRAHTPEMSTMGPYTMRYRGSVHRVAGGSVCGPFCVKICQDKLCKPDCYCSKFYTWTLQWRFLDRGDYCNSVRCHRESVYVSMCVTEVWEVCPRWLWDWSSSSTTPLVFSKFLQEIWRHWSCALDPRAHTPEMSTMGPYTMRYRGSVHRVAGGSVGGPFCVKICQDKLLKHDCNCTKFYTWTLKWRFLDRKDSCNSVRCHRESVYVSMCVTEVWEVCPRWLWDWSSSSTTPLVFSKFLQVIWRHWSCVLDPRAHTPEMSTMGPYTMRYRGSVHRVAGGSVCGPFCVKICQDKLCKPDCYCSKFYTWTLQWRFLDRGDYCNSVRCHRVIGSLSMCVTEVWEVCPRWLWDWSSCSTTSLVFSKFLQVIWRHWSCVLDPRAHTPEMSTMGPYTMRYRGSVHRVAGGSVGGPFCVKICQDKLLKHDCNCSKFYTWTLKWRFLDRGDYCNSVRCYRVIGSLSMCVTAVWEVCPRWLWDWSSCSTTSLVFSKFLQVIWRHWSCALDPRAHTPEMSTMGPYTMRYRGSVHRVAGGSVCGPFCVKICQDKLLKHDCNYTKYYTWTLKWPFLDRKDYCNSVRCQRESVYVCHGRVGSLSKMALRLK